MSLRNTLEALSGIAPGQLYRQLVFTKEIRAEAWQLLADVTSGGGDLGRHMEAVAEGYRLQGKRTVAAILLEIRQALGGGDVAARIRPYGGVAERILFEGLGRQDASRVFAGAARILRMEIRLRQAVLGAIAMPLLLMTGLLGLVLFFGHQLFPALEEVTDFDQLPPLQATVVSLTRAISGNPTLLFLGLALFVVGLVALMRLWTGPGRVQADRFPPFSLMRLQSGAGFIFAVVEYGRAKQAVTTELLDRIADVSPTYARSRITALSNRMVAAHSNLGEAALLAGQGFPSPDLVAVLRVLWREQGGVERVGLFLERWLERIEALIRARMAAVNAILMVAITLALLALMSIALPIVDQINQGIQSV